MVTVTVHLHTVLQAQAPEGQGRRLALSLPPGTDLAGLLERLQIDYPEPLVLIVNGRWAEPSRVLVDGDDIHLVPPIAGGAAGRRAARRRRRESV